MSGARRLALVTGGTSGIGAAVVAALLGEGWRVVATSRNPDSGHRGDGLCLEALDLLGGTSDLARWLADFEERHGIPDLVVNNAGAGVFGYAVDFPASEAAAQLRLLLGAPIEISLWACRVMRQRGSGTLVNISSLAAELPLPLLPAYNAGKAGLSQFTRSLWVEDGRVPVVLDFRPGDFRTPFNRAVARYSTGAPADAVWEALEHHINEAPPPWQLAARLVAAVGRGRSGTVRCGGWFQARLAVLGFRVLPFRVMRRLLRLYYRLGAG